jgi:hypothetical protein
LKTWMPYKTCARSHCWGGERILISHLSIFIWILHSLACKWVWRFHAFAIEMCFVGHHVAVCRERDRGKLSLFRQLFADQVVVSAKVLEAVCVCRTREIRSSPVRTRCSRQASLAKPGRSLRKIRIIFQNTIPHIFYFWVNMFLSSDNSWMH